MQLPNVIYQMEVFADQPAQIIKENRKGIIGDLMYAIMSKSFFFFAEIVLGTTVPGNAGGNESKTHPFLHEQCSSSGRI